MEETASTAPTHMVVVGASAGGLQPLTELCATLDGEAARAAVLVVQHLSPSHPTLLPNLLSQHAPLPVRALDSDEPIEAGAIYVAPGGHVVSVDRDTLRLAESPPGDLRSIDHAMRSAAASWGDRAVAVILSGSGNDGKEGARAIRGAGGLVMAQEPDTAEFPSMPEAVLGAGLVQRSASPWQIGDLVDAHLRGMEVALDGPLRSEPPEDASAKRLVETLERVFGIDFSRYKALTLQRRVHRRMASLGVRSEVEFLERVEDDPREAERLYGDVLIGVTEAFRDPGHFRSLAREVVEPLFEEAQPLRVWDCACASGEETYSLAILFAEEAERRGRPLSDIRIFATDVREKALEVAAEGLYSAEALAPLGPERRERWFREEAAGWRAHQELREMILFTSHDVLADPPFTRIDLVVCRNLLIYLTGEAQQSVLGSFMFALDSQRYLFLGPSESLGELAPGFDVLDRRARIFRKRAASMPDRRRIPLPTPAHLGPRARRAAPPLQDAYESLLQAYVPPSLMIDREHKLVHVFGDAARFLQLGTGRVTGRVTDLLPRPMVAPVVASLQQVFRTGEPTSLVVDGPDASKRIELGVRSLVSGEHVNALLSFREIAIETTAEPEVMGRTKALELELERTRSHLQGMIEQLSASSEELRATNEELTVSNEELQSANEELHSVNEELYTVNSEHQRKIEELERANADIDNLLRASDIGILFLDARQRVRLATETAGTLFHLDPRDVGRPLREIAARFDASTFLDEIEALEVGTTPIERQVTTDEGNVLLVRALPYRNADGSLGGAVITTADLTRLRRAEAEMVAREKRFRQLADNIPDAFELEDLASGERLYANPAYGALLENDEWLSRVHAADVDKVRAMRDESRTKASEVRFRLTDEAGVRVRHLVRRSFPFDENEQFRRVTITRDVSAEARRAERERAARKVREEYAETITTILDSTSDWLLLVDDTFRVTEANRAARVALGLTADQLRGRRVRDLGMGGLGEVLDEALGEALDGVTQTHEWGTGDYRLEREDEAPLDLQYLISRVDTDDDRRAFVCSVRDVSAWQRLETERLESARSIERLVGALPIGAAFLDDGLRYVHANERYLTLLNRTGEQVIGRAAEDVLPSALVPVARPRLASALAGRAVEFHVTVQVEGRSVPARVRYVPRTDSRDRVTGLFVLIEAQLARGEIEDLQTSQQRESLGLLAGGVAHDFNNLLVAILGNASLARESSSAEETRESLDEIVEASHRAQELAEQLLAYAGRGKFVVEVAELADIVQSMSRLLGLTTREKASLELDLKTEGCRARLDARQTRQILLNLVGNAAQAIEGDGGHITVRTYASELSRHDLDLLGEARVQPGPFAVLEVEDDGPGIAPDVRTRIFEPFFTTRKEGRGLGLAAVDGIVRGHGGFPVCRSKVGQGTRFSMYFPAVAPSHELASPDGTAPQPKETRMLALVVDDEASVRRLAARVLKRRGIGVIEAENGADALALMAEHEDRVGLMVLDVTMPGMSGLEVHAKVREENSALPIVLTSGYSDMTLESVADSAHTVFLKKPWRVDELMQVVERALG